MSKLDEAKINLKSTLERLEKAVDIALKNTVSQNNDDTSKIKNDIELLKSENNKIKLELEDKIAEIKYLREENFRIQADLGELSESNLKLQAKNSEAVRRVDLIIGEFKNYITSHGGL